ncbi:MAG: hypothetical protein AB1782_21145 [Cyanobacteriota bacterium]
MTPIDELKIFYTSGKHFNDALKILACASISEITLLLDKVNYYLEHINVITSSSSIPKNTTSLKTKQEFLERLQNILASEIERRASLST